MILLRYGEPRDFLAISLIARKNDDTLGYIPYALIKESLTKKLVLVAEEECIVGFVLYHHRKDDKTTLSYLCVAEHMRGFGIGSMLVAGCVQASMHAGKKELVLKAKEGIPANEFYRKQGFLLTKRVQGRKNRLCCWSLVISE